MSFSTIKCLETGFPFFTKQSILHGQFFRFPIHSFFTLSLFPQVSNSTFSWAWKEQCIKHLLLVFLQFIFCIFCAAVVTEMKSVSVMEGETVTLKTDVTELWRDDEILLWLLLYSIKELNFMRTSV